MSTTLVANAFDRAFQSWPAKKWIAYRCPNCDTVNHLEVTPDMVAQGYLLEAPGPSFVVTRQVAIEKLLVRVKRGGISIKTLSYTWHVPAS